jgi:hypothetical protein
MKLFFRLPTLAGSGGEQQSSFEFNVNDNATLAEMRLAAVAAATRLRQQSTDATTKAVVESSEFVAQNALAGFNRVSVTNDVLFVLLM